MLNIYSERSDECIEFKIMCSFVVSLTSPLSGTKEWLKRNKRTLRVDKLDIVETWEGRGVKSYNFPIGTLLNYLESQTKNDGKLGLSVFDIIDYVILI